MDPAQEMIDAIKAGDEARVRVLLAEQPRLAAVSTAGGVSGVLLAVYYGHRSLAELLLAAKPAPDIFEAAATGRAEVVAGLLEQDPGLADAYAPDGFTALGLAAYFGHQPTAEVLLARGANPTQAARNSTHVQPLHSAVANRDAGAARALAALLLRHGADVNAQQEAGYTPLHEAAFHGDLALTQLLLAHGADPRLMTTEGQTPADLAEKYGHAEVLAVLRESG